MSTTGTAELTERRQYLTFRLHDEVFALEISSVREILELPAMTKVPRAQDFMLGVINVRGSVVPVADLRVKFGIQREKSTINTCVIIMEVDVGGEQAVIGALADSVLEVVDLSQEQIEQPPRIGTAVGAEFIKGVGKDNGRFLIVLDMDRIFSGGGVGGPEEGGAPGEEAAAG